MQFFLFFALYSLQAFAKDYPSVPNEYLVQIKPQLAIMDFNTSPERKLKILSRTLKTNVVQSITQNILLVRGPRPQSNPELIEYIEPNYLYKLEEVPNDPQLPESWGLINHGQADSKGLKGLIGVDINVQEAWVKTQGSHQVVVAVIDAGVDLTHEDLKDNRFINVKEAQGKPGIDDDGNGYVDDISGWNFATKSPQVTDQSGHGTHCAGIIGAKGNNGIGSSGVNWNVRIMPLRFFDKKGYGSQSAAIEAIQYAMKMRVRIASNSWGGGPESDILKGVIQAAGDAGVLFVASAGNDGEDTDKNPHYPSGYDLPNIISVGAITNQGALSTYSNFGKQSVHIVAPGKNVLSTIPGNKYETKSGTSMAAPFVSGVAALILSRENLDTVQLKKRILSTVTPLPELQDKVFSGGLVNAGAAVR